jgi:hypothetical protein
MSAPGRDRRHATVDEVIRELHDATRQSSGHSSLGMRSPIEYELRHADTIAGDQAS